MNEAQASQESSQVVLLTEGGFKTLQAELEHLTQVKRPEIAARIRESQEHGEFSEDNSELDEVKFEQAIVENRIADLKSIFGNANVLKPEDIPVDHVGIGSLLTVKDLDYGDTFEIRVVTSVEADPSNDTVSTESPMGVALLGHLANEEVAFATPDGLKRYQIVSIGR